MRILITGAGGQVGFEAARSLAGLGEILCADRVADPALGIAHALDLADAEALRAGVRALAPDVIVNAAAHTAVDAAEDEPELADALNHRAVVVLADVARERGALLLHYSTDYVFGGDGREPYREDHATAPKSVYGRSKLAGEQALAVSGCAFLLLRTAWVYAARGRNFLLTMLRAAAQRPELTVVDDQVGCPTTARFLADTTATLVRRWSQTDAAGRRALEGACHVAGAGQVSWCGFARAIMVQAHALGLLPQATPVRAIASSDYPAKAPRPAYSVLDTTRLRAVFGVTPPHWSQGLQQTLLELAEARRALSATGFEVRRC
ncbi:MAG: dTDP-4-dehydrorhamnose reductase [Xanthomonadales bacterium]|nr:dTDP-4-dehydrorhamnose reductase [Xanthomonadales bacterium]MCC6594069.1 dTDP-4-dehydrorhamnose reductase [Xanthomonadales bacterium]MCE7930899.1 dTDP-4-dehydrorhamnose reductase [Xanthomonadales bacterium PRO6]